jgi:hypothetical protein
MSLNIKNPETYALVKELARRKGVSMTFAVHSAVQQQIDKENQPPPGFANWLMRISRETAPLIPAAKTSTELLDELYDAETGLPR